MSPKCRLFTLQACCLKSPFWNFTVFWKIGNTEKVTPISVSQIFSGLGLSRSSVWRIVRKKLSWFPFKPKLVQKLTPEHKVARQEACNFFSKKVAIGLREEFGQMRRSGSRSGGWVSESVECAGLAWLMVGWSYTGLILVQLWQGRYTLICSRKWFGQLSSILPLEGVTGFSKMVPPRTQLCQSEPTWKSSLGTE